MKASARCSQDIGDSESSYFLQKGKKHVLFSVIFLLLKLEPIAVISITVPHHSTSISRIFFLFLFPFLFCLHIFPDLRKLPCKCFWQFLFIQGRKKKCLLRILNRFSKFMPVCFTQQKFLKIIFPPRY